MVSSELRRLQILGVGLIILTAFASLPGLLDKILSLLGAALLLVYLGVIWRIERRERQADARSNAAVASSDQM